MRKGFALPLVLAVVVVIGAFYAGLFLYFKLFPPYDIGRIPPKPSPSTQSSSSAQRDETPKWETYTSVDNTYTFRYPNGWDIRVQEGFVEVYCSVPGEVPQSTKPCDPKFNHGYFVVHKLIYTSTDEFLSKHQDQYVDVKRLTFQGKDALRVVYPGSSQSGGSYLEWVVNHRGSTYKISLIYRNLFNAKSYSEFETPNPDILSTFRFD